MAYAIMRIDKINTQKELSSRYKHNFRVYDVANADDARRTDNFEPVDLCGKTYARVYDEEITRLQAAGAITKQVRKDAVRGFEVMLSYSYGHDDMDVDAWVKKNVEWLNKTFNPPENKIVYNDQFTGEQKELVSNNVKSVVVHMDEEVPHIHAFIVPIDDKGHLNAKYYTANRAVLSRMQTEYAKEMKTFGLKRGEEKSAGSFVDMSRYHQKAKNAVCAELPEPYPDEPVAEYRLRAEEEFQTEKVHHAEDVRLLNQKINALSAELSRLYESQNVEQEKSGRQIIKMCSELGIEDASQERIRQARRTLAKAENFEEARNSYPDKKRVERIYEEYNELAEYGRKKRKKEQQKTQG